MANFNPNDYETVDSRIRRFYADHPDGAIRTELVEAAGEVGATRWTVKASVWKAADSGRDAPDGTGYAFEVDGTGMANKTSALENCETSAIGRALANTGYSGDKRATREEMLKTQQAELEAAIPGAIEALQAADSMEALQVAWNAAGASGATRDPRVVQVKEQRKKVLSNG